MFLLRLMTILWLTKVYNRFTITTYVVSQFFSEKETMLWFIVDYCFIVDCGCHFHQINSYNVVYWLIGSIFVDSAYQIVQNGMAGWWLTYPSEKYDYEFVNGVGMTSHI